MEKYFPQCLNYKCWRRKKEDCWSHLIGIKRTFSFSQIKCHVFYASKYKHRCKIGNWFHTGVVRPYGTAGSLIPWNFNQFSSPFFLFNYHSTIGPRYICCTTRVFWNIIHHVRSKPKKLLVFRSNKTKGPKKVIHAWFLTDTCCSFFQFLLESVVISITLRVQFGTATYVK